MTRGRRRLRLERAGPASITSSPLPRSGFAQPALSDSAPPSRTAVFRSSYATPPLPLLDPASTSGAPYTAVPAAFELRDALAAKRRALPELPLARLALDMGPLVIGVVGTRVRRSVALVGPSINIAARILKLAPPSGIIATESVVEHAKRTDPDLASQFARLPEPQHLKGVERGPLELYVVPG